MEVIQRKLEAEKAQVAEQKVQQRQKSINSLLQNQQTQLTINYISQKLQSLSFSQISSYSASEISKLLFEPELKVLEQQFKQFPDEQCSLQQFVIMMLRVMKFDIEVCPQASIGLREMFATIAAGARLIDYQSLFKYVVGQVVSAKEQVSNTEFQMRFHQNKLQDFLFHDRGIKRVAYSKEMKVTICLDRDSNQLKFYDRDMKLTGRFIPSKDKHEGRNPQIMDMGFCELYGRVGMVLDDGSLSVISLKAILHPQLQATGAFSSQFTVKAPATMKLVFFLEMLSKWISISDDDQVFLYDLERQRPEERCQQVNLGVSDLQITDVVQLTVLNMVAVISGNQVIFFNQNLSQKHYVFSHGCNIRAFRFSEPENKFYVSGKESTITMFERDKVLNDFKVRTIDLGKFKANSFEIFPQVGVILLVDDDCNVRLFDYHKKVVNQQQNFRQIKKNQEELMLTKFNKHEFCLFQTYMLVLTIDKVAIQTQAQTRFSPYCHYNPSRQLLHCSLNNQVVSVHLLSGQVQDVYTEDNSNIAKPLSFFLGNRAHVFQISDAGFMFELYFNDEKLEGENRNYKRKINFERIVGALFDEEKRVVLVWSDTKVLQIKNDGANNFSYLNSFEFLNGEKIRDVQWNSGLITIFCASTAILDFNCFSTKLLDCRKFRPTNLQLEASEEDTEILQYVRLDLHKLEALLCTNNIIFICGEGKVGCLKVEELLPKSKTTYNFTKIKYQKLVNKRKIKKTDGYDSEKDNFIEQITKTLFVFDSSGYMVSIDLTQILKKFDSDSRIEILHLINQESRVGFSKGGCVLDSPIKPLVKTITKSTIIDLGKPKTIKVWKPHEKQVIQIIGIDFEQPCMITFANDGYLKLWNDKCQHLFALKMPNFAKQLWRMEEIQKQKCAANIEKMQRLVREYNRRIKKQKEGQSPQYLIHKFKNFKRDNLFDKASLIQPFAIEIENKQVQDFMNKTQMPIRRFSLQEKKSKRNISTSAQKSPQISPWKKNNKFIQLVQAVDKKHRSDKLPIELGKLRTSLDVRKQTTQQSPQKVMRVTFLPQLDQYAPQPKQPEQVVDNQGFDLYGDSEQGLQTCMYLRNRRLGPRINKFDQIDKQFQRKRMKQFKNAKKNAVIKITKKEQHRLEKQAKKEMKGDLMDNIKKIFQEQNKEVFRTKVGRMREIPDLMIRKVEES